MVHAFYVLSKKTIANRNFQRFSLLEVLYFYHYNCEAFQENFCVLYMTWFNVFFFFRDIQWFQHYLLQIFFFRVIELLLDHWEISSDHTCTDVLLDSPFCSADHLTCLSFHQGHAVLIIVASLVAVQLLSHVHSLPHHELYHARLPCLPLFPEFAQTHIHGVSDAVQPPNPLSHPSPRALTLSQHQGLFQ